MRPQSDEPLLAQYAENFLRRGIAPCPYTFEDRGWLAPGQRLESYWCWSGGPQYRNGIEVWNLRETILTGHPYDVTGQCQARTVSGRVIVARSRALDAPRCPAGFELRTSRTTGRPECWRLPPVACRVELEGLPAEVEPGGRLADLRARVRCSGRSPEGIAVAITPEVVPQSGGHAHHDAQRPPGAVGFPQGNVTNAAGELPFTFTAPAAAGDHTLTARCAAESCGEAVGEVWVGVKGLEPIIPASDPSIGPLYVLIGQDAHHPNNHYLKPDVIGQLQRLAFAYRQRFPSDPPLYLNDASLERGGLFDSYWENKEKGTKRTVWWTPPHNTHRYGEDIDIRANPAVNSGTAIPERNFGMFIKLACQYQGVADIHSPGTSNQHFHVHFKGCAASPRTATFDSIDSTPPEPTPEPIPPPRG